MHCMVPMAGGCPDTPTQDTRVLRAPIAQNTHGAGAPVAWDGSGSEAPARLGAPVAVAALGAGGRDAPRSGVCAVQRIPRDRVT